MPAIDRRASRAGTVALLSDIPEWLVMDKNFVTGIYGSGKTCFARKYAAERGIEFTSFDKLYDYSNKDNQSKRILHNLPSSFVMDAIPIDENAAWNDFFEYEADNDVLVVCVYCPDEEEWIKRLSDKAGNGKQTLYKFLKIYRDFVKLAKRLRDVSRNLKSHGDFVRLIKRLCGKAVLGISTAWRAPRERTKKVTIANVDAREHLKNYRGFFTGNLPSLRKFRNVLFYDSSNNEFTSEDVMLERIQYKCFPLRDRLDKVGQGYDKGYQDIEILNFVGYSKSYETWENIKGLVDWEGKKVIDLGCFHGYFSFKVEDCGGSVQGFDRGSSVLVTARMINDIRGGNVVFKEWVGGDDIPECDVILCLNVLHHFGDRDVQDKAVSKMNCETAVFEIKKDQRLLIEKYFGEIAEVESHRQNRIILLCNKG